MTDQGGIHRGRHESPALSDISQLTVLSRSPSPPECSGSYPDQEPSEKAETGTELQLYATSRCMFPNLKRKSSAAIPALISTKVQKKQSSQTVTQQKLPWKIRKPQVPKAARSKLPALRTTIQKAVPTRGVGGLGLLRQLPKEIRDTVYAFALVIKSPVSAKECCGPTSTERERDACKKHGGSCKKIGKGNGVYVEESSDKWYGRFNILLISRDVYEEAAWVLYNHGTLLLKVNQAFATYLNDCPPKIVYRFQKLPNNKHAERMWMMAARFRNVRFELPAPTLKWGNPLVYTAHLLEAVSLLFKAWELQPYKSMTVGPHQVIVQLGNIYSCTVPFNIEASREDVFEWAALHCPFHITNMDRVGRESGQNLERMVEIIGRRQGRSRWKIVVESVSEDNDEITQEGAAWLCVLGDTCVNHGVTLETDVTVF